VNYGDDITSHIRKAHKLKWDKLENARKSNERGLLVNRNNFLHFPLLNNNYFLYYIV